MALPTRKNVEYLHPKLVRAALKSRKETALIDVREFGQYGEGHPFFAVNVPYSRLEFEAVRLLPSMSADIILIDGGDGVAERAAERLAAIGYRRIFIMQDGAPGWAAAGFSLFKGVNVPSKAFGELVEHALQTPVVDPHQLREWQTSGLDFLLLDGRTPEEYAKMTIPGAVNCPNGELAYRIHDLLLEADGYLPIVIHCAGRTRSIIGAETLRLLGLQNPIYALRNGTQGWRIAGFELQYNSIPHLSSAEKSIERTQARSFRQQYSIPSLGVNDVIRLRSEENCTMYIFDVRTAEEFNAEHIQGAIHAPGGQLVQATDHWIAVRGAWIILVDNTGGIRASMAAYWLRRMGYNVSVLEGDVPSFLTTSADEQSEPLQGLVSDLADLPLADLRAALMAGATILDLNSSHTFRAAHISGAQWTIRPALHRLNVKNRPVVLTSSDRRVSELAAIDLKELGCSQVNYIPGAPKEWNDLGLQITSSPGIPNDADCIDFLYFVHDRHEGNLDAARRYLEWETNLINQMDESELSAFRVTSQHRTDVNSRGH